MPTQEQTTSQSEPEKKPYHPPQLLVHGVIQNLTLAGTAGFAEGMGMGGPMMA